MYARIQTTASRPDNADKLARELVEMISGHPGNAGLILLEGTLITLWTNREDAELASERSQAGRGPRPVTIQTDDIYQIEDDRPGTAAGRPATAGWIGYFDGPLNAVQLATIRRAGAERIRPALQSLPGLVRTLTLWHPGDTKFAVVHLATSADSVREIGDAVMSTRLLDGEDPALLPGPDRMATSPVVAYETV
ncbi:hypothetical protein FHR83_005655 [Actinoplanes campanulatus]|uniref:Uncharacterized protein n=1 Tax=Actinoplanes campanulatus TaxID=113559 RepID=A0A7W5AKW8_9ACTN|nr:hypothetical protein [Actinoplanes campanulatus]MBB3097970.1 hypothetical protein [Actinoplanes campanulatus]GGN31659.1 hypothetical protein GCM10010109_52070 [Actinoplanes campanulatus]GID41357.1 hypothetical protein Aca09nite_78630 [Actinoplanes campanulatus]